MESCGSRYNYNEHHDLLNTHNLNSHKRCSSNDLPNYQLKLPRLEYDYASTSYTYDMYETNYDDHYESRHNSDHRESDNGSPKNVWYEDTIRGDECFPFSLLEQENTHLEKRCDRYEKSSRYYDLEHRYEEMGRCMESRNMYYDEPSSCRGLSYEHFEIDLNTSQSYNWECNKREEERKMHERIREQNERSEFRLKHSKDNLVTVDSNYDRKKQCNQFENFEYNLLKNKRRERRRSFQLRQNKLKAQEENLHKESKQSKNSNQKIKQQSTFQEHKIYPQKNDETNASNIYEIVNEVEKRNGVAKQFVLFLCTQQSYSADKTLATSARRSRVAYKCMKTGEERVKKSKVLQEYEVIIDGYTIAKNFVADDNAGDVLQKQAIELLREKSFTVLVKSPHEGDVVKREDIEGIVPDKERLYEIPEDNKGLQIMKLMGWSGMGLGKREDGMKSPIIVSKNITSFSRKKVVEKSLFNEQIRVYLTKFNKSQNCNNQVFNSEFTDQERSVVRDVALDLGLRINGVREDGKKCIVVMKSLRPTKLVEQLLLNNNAAKSFTLIGPVSILKKYNLNRLESNEGFVDNFVKKMKKQQVLEIQLEENKLITNVEISKEDFNNLMQVRGQKGYKSKLVIIIGKREGYSSLLNDIRSCGLKPKLKRTKLTDSNKSKYTLTINDELVAEEIGEKVEIVQERLSDQAYDIFHKYCFVIQRNENYRMKISKSTEVNGKIPDWSCKEFLMEYFTNYSQGNILDALIFTSEFTISEKNKINATARSIGLKIFCVGKNYKHIAIRKIFHPLELVERLIAIGGQCNSYELIWPKIITGNTASEPPETTTEDCILIDEKSPINDRINVDTKVKKECETIISITTNKQLQETDIENLTKIRNQNGIRGKLVIFINSEENEYYNLVCSAKKVHLKTTITLLQTGKYALKFNDEIIATSYESDKNILAKFALESLSHTCYSIVQQNNPSIGRFIQRDCPHITEKKLLSICFENYLKEPTLDHLVFPSHIPNFQWQMVIETARKFNLNVLKTRLKSKEKRIIISKNLSPWEMVEHLLITEGKSLNYQLIPPKILQNEILTNLPTVLNDTIEFTYDIVTNDQEVLPKESDESSKVEFKFKEEDKELLAKVQRQSGFRGKLVLIHERVNPLTDFQIIASSLFRCHMNFNVNREIITDSSLFNYELFIQGEFVDKVAAENLTEAKEMLGLRVLKSLQETCFTVEILHETKGKGVLRLGKRCRKNNEGKISNTEQEALLKNVYNYLKDYKNSRNINHLVFQDNYSLKEKKLIQNFARDKLQLRARYFRKRGKRCLLICKNIEPWKLVENLLVLGSNVHELIRPTKL